MGATGMRATRTVATTIRIDAALLADLDALVSRTPDATRSRLIREAIRELIRRAAKEGGQ